MNLKSTMFVIIGMLFPLAAIAEQTDSSDSLAFRPSGGGFNRGGGGVRSGYVAPGYRSGYRAGMTSGYRSGYRAGVVPGYRSGYRAGVVPGYRTGYRAGVVPGYRTGYRAGVVPGYRPGYRPYYPGYRPGYRPYYPRYRPYYPYPRYAPVPYYPGSGYAYGTSTCVVADQFGRQYVGYGPNASSDALSQCQASYY